MEDKLLDEMKDFISDAADVMSDADDDGLPFEPFDAFSTDPVEFGEMGRRMLDKVENIFDLTRMYNRHSGKYMKACTLLDRGIRMLASVCVTRSAMERSRFPLPELGQLTTGKLYRMASFNYRKLDTALTERLQKGNDLYPELTRMFFRYFNLLNRLRATELRIHKYYDKKYYGKEDFGPVIRGLAFSKKSWTRSDTSDKEEAPAFRSAPAFPVIKSEIGNQKSEISGQEPGIQNSEFRIQKSDGGTSAAESADIAAENGDQSSKSEIGNQKSETEDRIQNSEFRIQKSNGCTPPAEFVETAADNGDQSSNSEISGKWPVISGKERGIQNSEFGIQKSDGGTSAAESADIAAESGDQSSKSEIGNKKSEISGQGSVISGRETGIRDPGGGAPGAVRKTDSGSKGDEELSFIRGIRDMLSRRRVDKDAPPGTELRDTSGIVQDAVRRSGGKGHIQFTANEILALAADPYLDCFYPELSGQIRQAESEIRNQK